MGATEMTEIHDYEKGRMTAIGLLGLWKEGSMHNTRGYGKWVVAC